MTTWFDTPDFKQTKVSLQKGIYSQKFIKFIKLKWEKKRFFEIGFQNKNDWMSQFNKSKYFIEKKFPPKTKKI